MVFKAAPDPVLYVKFVEFLKTGVFSVFLCVSLFCLSVDINPALVLPHMFMSCFCVIHLYVLCLTSGLLLLWFYSRVYWWLFVTKSLENSFKCCSPYYWGICVTANYRKTDIRTHFVWIWVWLFNHLQGPLQVTLYADVWKSVARFSNCI